MRPHHNLQLSDVFRSKPSSVLGELELAWAASGWFDRWTIIRVNTAQWKNIHKITLSFVFSTVSFPLNRLLTATESSCYCGINCDNFHPSELSIFWGLFCPFSKVFQKFSRHPPPFDVQTAPSAGRNRAVLLSGINCDNFYPPDLSFFCLFFGHF